MTKLTIPRDNYLHNRTSYISNLIQTKGSDYMDDPKNKGEIERGFEKYHAQQTRIKELKKQILSPLKEILPEEQYVVVEEIVRRLDIEENDLEKLVLRKKIKLPKGNLIAEIMLARSTQIKSGKRNMGDYTVPMMFKDCPFGEY
jgi:hypothetical protein